LDYLEPDQQDDLRTSLKHLPGNMDHLRTKMVITEADANRAKQTIEETREQIFAELERIRDRHRQRKQDCAKILDSGNKMQEIAQSMAAIEQQLSQTQLAIEIKVAAKQAQPELEDKLGTQAEFDFEPESESESKPTK
jgi:septal ring factor EnvC (AmiA/AmiB activator)